MCYSWQHRAHKFLPPFPAECFHRIRPDSRPDMFHSASSTYHPCTQCSSLHRYTDCSAQHKAGRCACNLHCQSHKTQQGTPPHTAMCSSGKHLVCIRDKYELPYTCGSSRHKANIRHLHRSYRQVLRGSIQWGISARTSPLGPETCHSYTQCKDRLRHTWHNHLHISCKCGPHLWYHRRRNERDNSGCTGGRRSGRCCYCRQYISLLTHRQHSWEGKESKYLLLAGSRWVLPGNTP